MKKQFLSVTGLVALMFSTLVAADQCAYVSQEQAQAAAQALPKGGKFVPFCQPCGETQFPAMAAQVAESSVVHSLPATDTGLDQDYWELQVNGKGVDLAYTYVRQAGGMFVNLAKLAGCPVSGVERQYDADGQPSVGSPYIPPPKK